MLELLVRRQGSTVSRAELFDHAWDPMATPNSNVVDVVIAALRRKLRHPPLINATHGIGYCLAP